MGSEGAKQDKVVKARGLTGNPTQAPLMPLCYRLENQTELAMHIVSGTAVILTLALVAQTAAALALQPSTPMSSWTEASDADKKELLDRLVKSDGAARASVRKCLGETASAPGHSELPIGDIVSACVKMGNSGQTV